MLWRWHMVWLRLPVWQSVCILVWTGRTGSNISQRCNRHHRVARVFIGSQIRILKVRVQLCVIDNKAHSGYNSTTQINTWHIHSYYWSPCLCVMGAHCSPRARSPGTASAKQCKYLGSPVAQWKMKLRLSPRVRFINAFGSPWTEASSTYLQVFVWKPRFPFFTLQFLPGPGLWQEAENRYLSDVGAVAFRAPH